MNKLAMPTLFQDNIITFPKAKPFLKWAGGKSQLIAALEERLPQSILNSRTIEVYVEPFVGGGAFFFYLKSNYVIKKAYLFDINKDLIVAYKVVQVYPHALIERLLSIEKEYLSLSEDEQRKFFYEIRDLYNSQKKEFDFSNLSEDWVSRAAYMIFLNRTCYNGLYRLNRNGEFNVPYGKYKNPKICDKENILEASKALQNTEIICADFEESKRYISKGALVYLDPPYRPLSKTSNFTNYTEDGFSEEDQIRLAKYFREVHKRGAYILLSNSDPKNFDPNDDFFEVLYEGFVIERVPARRYINSNARGRGFIMELIIRNYSGGMKNG
jgi:DNA adenine methylase